MAQTLSKTPVTCVIEDEDCRGGLAIYLSQTDEADRTRWEIEVWANSGDGLIWVGKLTTCPAQSGSQKTRLVATVAVPGAHSFEVIVRAAARLGSEAQRYSGEILLSAGHPGGQLPGLVRVNERSKYYAGTGAAVVTLAPGERVLSWSAFSTGAGATLVYGVTGTAPDTIPIPTSGVVSGGPVEAGPQSLIFQFQNPNFGGYFIQVAESG